MKPPAAPRPLLAALAFVLAAAGGAAAVLSAAPGRVLADGSECCGGDEAAKEDCGGCKDGGACDKGACDGAKKEDGGACHGGAKAEGAKDAEAAKPAAGPLLVDLGNAKCPVMGGDADGRTFSEWNGLRVAHCCPGCGKKFAKDPEKLLDAAKIEWRAAAEAVKAVNDAKPDATAKAMAELRAKFKVVREPAAAPAVGELLVDLGNARCPVMGGPADGKTYSEWNGLRVAHCCPGCGKKFAKDPAAALDAKKIEWKAAAAAVEKVRAAKTDEDRATAMAELRAGFTVVRAPAAPAPAEK